MWSRSRIRSYTVRCCGAGGRRLTGSSGSLSVGVLRPVGVAVRPGGSDPYGP